MKKIIKSEIIKWKDLLSVNLIWNEKFNWNVEIIRNDVEFKFLKL